jgi:arylsulfatase A-like enzyme
MSMSRRTLLTGGAALACLGATGSGRAPDGRPWNVLWISSDQHNVRWTGFEGHPLVKTPNLDALAAQSLRLRNTYVSAPSCAPTRQSWLTGLWPREHGQLHNALGLDPANRGLPTLWREGGYRTGCVGKLHTWADESQPGFMGFERVFNEDASPQDFDALRRELRGLQGGAAKTWKPPQEQALWDAMPAPDLHGKVHGAPYLSPDWVLVQQSRRWLQAQRSEPFFLYTSLRLPHHPFTLLEDFYFRYDPAELLDLAVASGLDTPCPSAEKNRARRGWARLTPEQTALLHARYAGAIEQTDWLIGLLLRELEDLGLADNTILVYSSDHGDMAGDHGLWWKGVMFEGAARKPLLVRMPGVLAPGVHEGRVNEVDLLPTLAGLCGLSAGQVSGRDLSEVLLTGSPGQRFACSFYDLRGQRAELAMCRDERFKLMRHGTRLYGGEQLLFDLQEDPNETRDVSKDHRSTVRTLGRQLDRLEASMRPRYPGVPQPKGEAG